MDTSQPILIISFGNILLIGAWGKDFSFMTGIFKAFLQTILLYSGFQLITFNCIFVSHVDVILIHS